MSGAELQDSGELLTILEDTTVRDINSLSFIRNDWQLSQYPEVAQTSRGYTNNSSTERNVATEVDVTRNSQMVQLDDVRNFLEPPLELADLGEG